jgi:hypothetical protein
MTVARREVVFVGGGYRTVSFLSAQPWLLDRDVEIIERSGGLGGGAFADLDCLSTSVANRFVGGVHPTVAADVADSQRLRALRRSDAEPLAVTEVAAVMQDIGSVVAARVRQHGRVRCGSTVDHVHLGPAGGAGALVRLADGQQVACDHVVIATGREERPHPELDTWRPKTLPSAEALSLRRAPALRTRLRAAGGPVVIAGGSHSAVAVLLRLIRLREDCERPDLPLVLLRRGPVRLHYPCLTDAHEQCDEVVEAPIDPVADVCPATGQVNRDSGLRGVGRAVYRELVAGKVSAARVQTVSSLRDAAILLEEAALIVQALGYHGRAPTIIAAGVGIRPARDGTRLANLADGTGLIGSRPVPGLSVLRVEPTPPVVRDHGLYGQGLYDALGRRLRGLLGVPE